MQTKLKHLADAWAIKSDYKRKAMPEVLQYNKQYRAENPDKYGYNADIEAYILSKENISSELRKQLSTEVYLSQQDIREEKEEKDRNEMIAKGYIVLNKEACDQAIKENKKLEVIAEIETDLWAVKMDNVYRPKIDHKGNYWLMKPRAKTRGYYLSRFENAFCKLV